ncbi:MAG: fibronectin type III domain-containing protein [Lachnospiraceae bacterium]|nr:fibronectin type III domain-containing protein [Lachnospiraceae bacterium]
MMKQRITRICKRMAASLLTVAMCVTALPAGAFREVEAAGAKQPAERENPSIVYFVDCGDYVTSTVSEGDQLGTHNSVTDQAFGEDSVTGYQWGIVDTMDNVRTAACGGVFTDNTWPFEFNAANVDVDKLQSNRYTKDQGTDRYLQYDFELERGKYAVTVVCVNPWNNMDNPTVSAEVTKSAGDGGTEGQAGNERTETVLGQNLSCAQWQNVKASGEVSVTEESDNLSLYIRGSGGDAKCVNVAYILIESADDDVKVRKDKESLAIPAKAKDSNLALPDKGENGSTITWSSDNTDLIANDGKVTRPEGQNNVIVKLTATIKCGDAQDTKEFDVLVISRKTPAEVTDGRADTSVMYFVDCGDYVTDTVSEGDQFGIRNGVTDQAYQDDDITGYHWGIADTSDNPKTHPCGGVFTDNTWPYESNTAGADTAKENSNRYAKDQSGNGIEERFVDYAFELGAGTYDITVCCVNPWGVSNEPQIMVKQENTAQEGSARETVLAEKLEVAKGATETVTGTVEVAEGNDKLMVCVRGSGTQNDCVNVAYIKIKSVKAGMTEAENNVRLDKEALTLTDFTKTDLTLPTQGAKGSTITWESDKTEFISNDGKVTRPARGENDAVVTLTATISCQLEEETATDTKEFTVTVPAPKNPAPLTEGREDLAVVYFVDCGDFVVSTVNEGEQLGTHNSVTDQAYQDDDASGYQWGVVDQSEEYEGNNVVNPVPPANGGIYTANTWAFEQGLTEKQDYPKTKTNRYSKNFFEKGIEERFVDYAFELEEGTYEVTVGCANPWNCSNSPIVTARMEKAEQDKVLTQEGFAVPAEGAEVKGSLDIPEGGDKLILDVRGTGDENKCVNVAYIVITSHTHSFEAVDAKAKTCTEPGNLAYWKCSGCGRLFKDAEGKTETTLEEVTIPASHDFTDVVDNKDGTHSGSCTVCGTKVDAEAHTGGTATCIKKAECSVCGAEYGELTGHTGGKATCVAKAECSVCGTKYGELAAHTGGKATCSQQAECSVCGTKYGELVPHKFTKQIKTDAYLANAGNCMEGVVYYYACEVCEAKGTETYKGEKQGHTLAAIQAKAATCKATGLNAHWKCTTCQIVFKDEQGKEETTMKELVVPKSKHTPSDIVDNEYGTHSYTCKVCRAKIQNEGHWGGEATCSTLAECEFCGAEYGDFLEHAWGEGVTTEATCTQDEVITFTCTVCGGTKTEEGSVKAPGHDNETSVMKATTKKDGSIASKCKVCGTETNITVNRIKTVSLKAEKLTYNKKAQKPAVTVKDSKGKSIAAANYTVSYKNNKNAGVATVTVKFKGNYSGTVKKSFHILPKGTAVSKVKAGKKGFQVTWKKQAVQASGYQIQYSANKNFKGKAAKIVTVSKSGTTKKNITKLKAKTKYYVRVRTYKKVKVSGKNKMICSGWSKEKTVTTKK